MIIDFVTCLNIKKAREAAQLAEKHAELARRVHLEQVLTDLLADLEAA